MGSTEQPDAPQPSPACRARHQCQGEDLGLLTPPPTRRQAHKGHQPEDALGLVVGHWLTALPAPGTRLARVLPSLAGPAEGPHQASGLSAYPPTATSHTALEALDTLTRNATSTEGGGNSAKNQEWMFFGINFLLLFL